MEKLINKFQIQGQLLGITEKKGGLINRTFLVMTTKKKYILQIINHHSFKNPRKLMENIVKITDYLHQRNYETMIIVLTKENDILIKDKERYVRMYEYIDDTITFNQCVEKRHAFELGTVIANFHEALSNYDVSELYLSIIDFHHTPKRYEKLLKSVKQSESDRFNNANILISFIKENESMISIIQDKIANQQIPLRVTHNDTKINNVLFDKKSNKGRCLIDLDTVMPGTWLFDFGDAIRISASLTTEDETDEEKIGFSLELFLYFSIGYLFKMYNVLTKIEIEYLAYSIPIITLELAMRFLTDYLENDQYFKVSYEEHNLNRAKNQLALYKIILTRLPQLQNIIEILVKRLSLYCENSLIL